MAKLTMLKGLPASGKSTRARELVATGNYIRVNRDELRAMLHDNKWSGKNEGMTVNAEKAIARIALSRGVSVVVDDCNLNPSNQELWESIAEQIPGATFGVESIDTEVGDCLVRDAAREKPVGPFVIINMALQYGLFPRPAKEFIICDIDGTIADPTHRRQYSHGPEKDWEKFFSLMHLDTPIEKTVEMLENYTQNGNPIVFVSARPEKYRDVTLKWMSENLPDTVTGLTLIMRKDADTRDDTIVKQEIYDTYFAPHEGKSGYPIESVIDDRPKVIKMWRANGLHVIDVGDGVEF